MLERMTTPIVIVACALTLAIALEPVRAHQQTAVRVPTSVLQRYAGEWVYPDGDIVTLRVIGEILFREVPGQRVPLVPLSETLFRLGPVFTAEFVTDPTGRMTQILTDGVAVEYRLRRKGSPPASAAAPPAPTVRVPRSVLERYVGVYEYIPGQMSRTDLRIVVRLKGDVLTRDAGEADMVLTPISETRFRVAGTSLTVEFVVDDAGVTQVLGSGGQQMLARLKRKP